MCEVGVLHDLSKQEALLVVILGATVGSVDVGHSSKARVSAAGRVNSHKCIPHPVAVLPFCQRVSN